MSPILAVVILSFGSAIFGAHVVGPTFVMTLKLSLGQGPVLGHHCRHYSNLTVMTSVQRGGTWVLETAESDTRGEKLGEH